MIEDRILTREVERWSHEARKYVTETESVEVQIRWPGGEPRRKPYTTPSRWVLNHVPYKATCELCGNDFTGESTICSPECAEAEIEHQRIAALSPQPVENGGGE